MSAIRVRALSRLGVIVAIFISLVAVGCGKTSSVTQTVTVTRPTQTTAATQITPATLTQAQTVKAGDAICTTAIKLQEPLVARLDAIKRSGISKEEMELKTAPPLEQLAGKTREASRLLQELHVTPESADSLFRNYASSLLELAVIEEQWSEALREEEHARLGVVEKEVMGIREHAREQAKGFGFHVCGVTTRTPVG